MKYLVAIALTLLLQSVVTAFEALGGFGSLRIEPAMPMLVLAAFGAPALGAALLAGAFGLISDLMSLSPLGLHMLIFSLVFFLTRSLIDWLGLKGLAPALVLVLFISVLSRVLFAGALLLFTEQAQALAHPLVHLASALTDALLMLPLWLVFKDLWKESDDGDFVSAQWGRR